MEKYTDNSAKKPAATEDKAFTLVKGELSPFKAEIYCDEFLDIMADVICNPGTKYNAVKEMVDGIKKPLTMKIDPEVYNGMFAVGERKDIELVCKYVTVDRIISCADNTGFTGMMDRVRGYLRELPVALRHVMSSDKYKDIFGIIAAAYLCSICNLGKVTSDVHKMDKSKDKVMSNVMDEMNTLTSVEPTVLSEAYAAACEYVKRVLFAYRDNNMIDLGSLRDALAEMFDGQLKEHFEKLHTQMSKDVSDSFSKFNQLIQDMKNADESEFSDDMEADPMITDPVDIPIENEDDSVLSTGEPTYVSSVELAVHEPATEPAPSDNTVVTGLEGIFNQKKKLKRISRDSIAYVKMKGANARNVDEATMIICYGVSIAERAAWYKELIQSQDERYVVPQTYAELDYIETEMNRTIDQLTSKPFFREKGHIYNRGYDWSAIGG